MKRTPAALTIALSLCLAAACAPQEPEPEPQESPRAGSTPRPPTSADTAQVSRHLREARAALNAPPADSDRYLRAGDSLEAAVQLRPGNAEAWFLLSRACLGELRLEKPRTRVEAERLEARLWEASCNAIRRRCTPERLDQTLDLLRARAGRAHPEARSYALIGEALEAADQPGRAWDYYALGARSVAGKERDALAAAERRTRATTSRELAQRASSAADAEARLELLSRAHYLATERAAAEGLRLRYYALAAERLSDAARAGLSPGAKIGVRHFVNAEGTQTQAGQELYEVVTRRLVAAGFQVVPAAELERRAAALALDLRLAHRPQALAGLGVDALLGAGLGQRVELQLLRVPAATLVARESLDRLADRELSQPPLPRLDPIQLEVKVLAERRLPGGAREELWVSEATVLREDDLFQVHVRVDSNAYLYVILRDGPKETQDVSERAPAFTRLYPKTHAIDPAVPAAFSRNPIQAQRLLRIPPDPRGFVLDGTEGIDTLYVLASRRRLLELEGLLERAASGAAGQEARADLERLLLARAARPLAGPTQSSEAVRLNAGEGRTRSERLDRVQGWGVAIRAIRFAHRAQPR